MEFQLRPWKHSDLDSLVRYANNPKIASFMTDAFPHPYGEEQGRAFIGYAQSGTPANIMAIEVEGEAVGGIGIHPQGDIYRRNAEMGYWIGEPFWGKGIITAAIQQMLRYAFDHFEVDRIFARPFATNEASQRVLQKAGFSLEAKLEGTILKNGITIDEYIYAFRRKDLYSLTL